MGGSIRFFSVGDRENIEVPDAQVEAVKYERTTKSGKKLVRYALRVYYQGRKLTKFVDEATYRRYAGRQESGSAGVSSREEPTMLHRDQQEQTLQDQRRKDRKWHSRLPKGTPGYKVAALAGSISDADAEEMLRAIEEGCERVDESQW
ncbi:MAG: hypothetical protein ABDI19_06430 [Armatimonadota bacterium]